MKRIFITSTGTGIGKTYICSNLVSELVEMGKDIFVAKPLISDWQDNAQSDTAILLSAAGKTLTHENINACSPWRFRAPLGADLAAVLEEKNIPFEDIVAYCNKLRAEYVIIEGCGGVMSPMVKGKTNLDLITGLDCFVIMVCGSYLGAISHILTAIDAMKLRGKMPDYLIISESEESIDLELMEQSIKPFIDIPYKIIKRGCRLELADIIP